MPKITAGMKAATFLLKLTPDEKAKLHRLAKQRNVSLSYAMRKGAELYLEEWFSEDPAPERQVGRWKT